MSLSTEVTVHCDDCGIWEHTNLGMARSSRAMLLARRADGWTSGKDEDGYRWDYCPACSKRRTA